MSSLKKGKLIICNEKGRPAETINFTFNPTNYTISSHTNLKSIDELGKDEAHSEFIGGPRRELSATLIFDSMSDDDLFSAMQLLTIKSLTEGYENQLKPITEKTKLLSKALHVDGSQHKTPMVIFSWGNLNFKGYIVSMTEEYTMFSMQGKPVRANVSLTITEEPDSSLSGKMSPFESPDRTKSRVIVEGMSLWGLAYEEYDDCEKWRVIAKANGIMNPLDVRPGQIIMIPALET